MRKRTVIIISIVFILSVALACLTACGGTARKEYIRIHIRANSNENIDQSVKLKVRDEIVAYLTPIADKAETKGEMMCLLQNNLPQITALAEKVLRVNGFSYKASARIGRENFPQKTYGDLTLDAGIYDALILNLGTGEGANWWCVAYPPLCFISAEEKENSNEIEYKSIIAKWFAQNSKGD